MDIPTITNPDYWDCECVSDPCNPYNYIHRKTIGHTSICLFCGANSEDQPDSLIVEVNDMVEYGSIKRQLLTPL